MNEQADARVQQVQDELARQQSSCIQKKDQEISEIAELKKQLEEATEKYREAIERNASIAELERINGEI